MPTKLVASPAVVGRAIAAEVMAGAMMSERIVDIDRWHWLAVTCLLSTGLLLWDSALALVHLVCAARTAQLAYTKRSLCAFPVQVNVVFLALIVATNLVASAELFCTALVCAGLRVTTGYCVVARLLALLPVNRREPWSWALVKNTLFARPTSGSVLSAAPPGSNAAA